MITLENTSAQSAPITVPSVASESVVSTGATARQLSVAEILSKPTSVTLTQADVKRSPRLSGSVEVGNPGDVDIESVINEYRSVADFRAQSARPKNQTFSDEVVFELFNLIMNGPVASYNVSTTHAWLFQVAITSHHS